MSKWVRLPALLWVTVALFPLCVPVAKAAGQRTVVELFTSQGCSSCPPADAIAGRLSTDPSVLVLSYHVNYWDGLGWRDPFASQASTDRQYAYAHALQERSVFTPQLVVNGVQSVVGSQEASVRAAVVAAHRSTPIIQVGLSRQNDGGFAVDLKGPMVNADVWEIRYVGRAITQIKGGENGGRTLETYNNVTHVRRLGTFTSGQTVLPPLKLPEDGLAVLVQAPNAGRILGAAAY